MNVSSPAPLLEVRRITKRFPGVLALADVDLALNGGQIRAVIGENGAGKSTLMKILGGVYSCDSGQILLEGRPVQLGSVRAAAQAGIALIHQELNLCDNLDVGANIFLGREPRWAGPLGLVNRTRIESEARRVLSLVGLDISPRTLLSSLPIGLQQMVEIAKALSANARILIMDEPTSSLSQRETQRLFAVMRDLRSKGVGILYISHRLGEVRALADGVVVLRDGKNAGELAQGEITHDRMVRLMVGRDLSQFYARKAHPVGDPALEVKDLITSAWPAHRLSFTVRAGEMVGVAGLVGAGRTEMLRALFAIDPILGGSIRVRGRPVEFVNPRDAIRAGLALVPEDRKQQGLILEMALGSNVSLAGLRSHRRMGGFMNRAWERSTALEMIRSLSIRTPGPHQETQYLSGGNQQKVVLGKWLAMKPRVLMMDEPTRGIDVGGKQEIYRLMEELAEQGVAILFVSGEMEEILGMSDRVLVMHEGSITGQLERSDLTEEAVMQLATGRTQAA